MIKDFRERSHWIRYLLFLCLLYIGMPLVHAGLLSPDNRYTEVSGVISGEGENYHATGDVNRNGTIIGWTPVDALTTPGAFSNAQGDAYIQALPNDGLSSSWDTGPSVDYYLTIDTPGIYRLSVRWESGGSFGADSLFFGIPELADGVGTGEPDWYEDSGHLSSDFDDKGFDGYGGPEENVSAASQISPMLFTFDTAGDYTFRIVSREDGVAVDAWQFVLEQILPEANDDAATLRWDQSARLDILKNDTGSLNPASLEIITQPTAGSVQIQSDNSVYYTHNGDEVSSDSFTYRLRETLTGEFVEAATVTLSFSSQPRFDSVFTQMPDNPPATSYSLTELLPNISFTYCHGIDSVPNDPNKLFIAEGDGKVWLIPDINAAVPQKLEYLDLTSSVLHDNNENAMKGVAVHPDYTNNGYIYLTYNTGTSKNVGPWGSRLSRFTRDPNNANQADPSSELILIDQLTEGFAHSIGICKFGPDGYLYVGFGDEGSQSDAYQNAQKIDKDIWSTIIRIDVDKLPGNLEPNAHSSIPVDSGTGLAHFSVPNDNPFIGATTFNAQPVDPNNVRTEMYAVGFRNPWQFEFDPNSTSLFVADVGRFQWEELSIIPKGGNGGWPWKEGLEPGVKSGQLINGAAEGDATLTDPILAYSHSVGSSITGGLYYEGDSYPELKNKYIFADYVSGSIWAIDLTEENPETEYLTGEGAIVGFTLDPTTGEILLLDRGSVGGSPTPGRILKLKSGGLNDQDSFPVALSDTNFFADLATLTPNPGGIYYEPNLRFWSDHADKTRWFVIPESADTVSFAQQASWSFPDGMVWVKHFDLEMERGNPATSHRIETRFLVKNSSGAYGVSYIWNDEQTEAYLAPDSGQNIDFQVTENNVVRTQTWRIPSRSECLTCHTPEAGHALSFNTLQLNRDGNIEDSSGNFINLLSDLGYLTGMTDDPSGLAYHVRPDQTEYSLEARVRSYLAVNCAYCHQSGGTAPDSWDGSYALTLSETGMVNGQTADAPADPTFRLLVPGDTAKSVIWHRMGETAGYSRMPPVGSNELDQEAIDLVTSWINNQLPQRLDYNQWRASHFGDTIDPAGEPTANGDLDTLDNESEFLWQTNPTVFSEAPIPTISVNGSTFIVKRPGMLGRSIFIETSSDLGQTDHWTRWNATGNENIPLPDGAEIDVSGTISGENAFFRYRIEEK
ncbi:MAG: PQQ-dependent sugar dehydrogenase [Verrucomicrobiota bacterium]